MKKRKETKGILILKDHNETDEIDFELDYLLSLTTPERFRLMEKKSLEIKQLLEQNGHRGDGIPSLLLQQEYAHAEGEILE